MVSSAAASAARDFESAVAAALALAARDAFWAASASDRDGSTITLDGAAAGASREKRPPIASVPLREPRVRRTLQALPRTRAWGSCTPADGARRAVEVAKRWRRLRWAKVQLLAPQ